MKPVSLFSSFQNALAGCTIAWREERNMRIESVVALLAILLAVALQVSAYEWLALFFAIGLVFTAELLNTALEEFCDMVQGNPDPHIGKIKDLAAGAVLAAALCALATGCIIFLPHLWMLFFV